jgi:hypothetical protein
MTPRKLVGGINISEEYTYYLFWRWKCFTRTLAVNFEICAVLWLRIRQYGTFDDILSFLNLTRSNQCFEHTWVYTGRWMDTTPSLLPEKSGWTPWLCIRWDWDTRECHSHNLCPGLWGNVLPSMANFRGRYRSCSMRLLVWLFWFLSYIENGI